MPTPEAARTRLAFETLISDTSALLISADPDDLDAVVTTALERLRVFFDVDRAGLLQVADDQVAVRPRYAAYGPGVAQVPPTFELERAFPWTHGRALLEHQPVVISRLEDLPPEAATDRETFRRLGVLSNLTVPIVSGAAVTHLVAMGSLRHEKQWPVEYLPRVRLLGEMIVGAVLRARSITDLRAAHNDLRRMRDRVEQENVYLRTEMAHRTVSGSIAGRSTAIRHALRLASQVACADTTVLLTGETGTGKERFASFIHEESDRRSRHMVRVNCSAIPSALIESELFGREKGAYTGALTRQVGRFELAHRSTLFLDEIGDLPQDVQVKLLRVLEERTVERLGSPTPVPLDVRIIAATNRDLDAAVRAGTFRSDLFYRFNVFPILVPPLRERREDLPSLVEELVRELNVTMRKRFDSVDRASLEAIVGYDWPGNVRELRNVLERGMILSSGPTLKVDVPNSKAVAHAVTAAPAPVTIGGLQDWEREHILRILEATGWRVRGPRAAAEVLGLKPTTLEKRMARLGIQRPSARLDP